VIDPEYNYETINVEAQSQNPHSLLHWMKRIIELRKRYRAFGRGSIEFLHPSNRRVIAFIRAWEEERILVVANLSRFVEYVELDLSAHRGQVAVELFSGRPFPPVGDLPYLLTLGPHSFYWFSLEEPRAGEAAGISAPAGRLPRILVAGGLEALLRGHGRESVERILPEVLRGRRWFGGKSQAIESARIVDALKGPEEGTAILMVEVSQASGSSTYVLPISWATGPQIEVVRHERPGAPLFEVESDDGELEAIAWDALEDESFCSGLLDAIGKRRKLRGSEGEILASRTGRFGALRGSAGEDLPASLLRAEQSNSSVRYGDRLMLKLFRRLGEGLNPDLEVGRFLTDKARFSHAPQLAGALEYHRGRAAPSTLAILHEQIQNEGDAWSYTLDEIERAFEAALVRHAEDPPVVPLRTGGLLDALDGDEPESADELVGGYLESARMLGQRTAELHLALACDPDSAGFAPEPFTSLYQRSLYQSMRTQAMRTFELLRERRSALPEGVAAEIDAVLAHEEGLLESFRSLVGDSFGGQRIRCHGDYHLGQVLFTGNDFVIIDFEGEPARPASERRLKRSCLRDVAGMLRSFDYAVNTVLLSSGERGSIRPDDVPLLEPWARAWRHFVSAHFLSAYLEPVRTAGLIPTGRRELETLLHALLLDKAVYELRYELDNRPEWIRIPARGIRGLLEDHD
jgi:maltose alpha-D-glucosyltransferase/alpha-amylase